MPSLCTIGLASLAAVPTLAFATPADKNTKRWSEGDPGCMTWDDAQTVVAHWGELIMNYSDAAADAYVAPHFVDWSESVNTLINTCPQGPSASAETTPLLAPSFTTRAEFKRGQSEQPSIDFQALQTWHTCNTVTARWKTTNTAPKNKVPDVKPVIGIFVLETVPVGDVFKIETAYSEFDAGAWLQNLQDWGICGESQDAVKDYAVMGGASASSEMAPTPTGSVAPPASSAAPPAGSVAVPAVDDTTYGNSSAWKA